MTNRPQNTLLRASAIFKKIDPPPIKKWFIEGVLRTRSWYLTTKNSRLTLGQRIIATLIRVLWCSYTMRIAGVSYHIPEWNHRLPKVAITVNRLKNKLLLGLTPTQSDQKWSLRGRLRSGHRGSSYGSLADYGEPPDLGEPPDFGGASDYGRGWSDYGSDQD